MDFAKLLEQHPEAIVAAAAFIVSIVTAGVAIWQARVQRKHNGLSVMPILDTHNWGQVHPRYTFPDGSIGQALEEKIYLRNIGLGPAQLKSYQIFLDRKEFDSSNQTLVEATLKSLFGPWIAQEAVFRFGGKYGLRPGDDLLLFHIVVKADNDAEIAAHRRTLGRFDVCVASNSIYGDSEVFDSRTDVTNRLM